MSAGLYFDPRKAPILNPRALCSNCTRIGTGPLCRPCEKLREQYPELVRLPDPPPPGAS